MEEIREMINSIPNEYNHLAVCSDRRKEFYIRVLDLRVKDLLNPVYEKTLNEIKEHMETDNVLKFVTLL